MEAYTGFAQVYELFMDNVPYEAWSRFLAGLLKEYGAAGGIVLELGCGTGKMTRLLAQAGFDMIGIDNSEEMLQIARDSSLLAQAGFDMTGIDNSEEMLQIARDSSFSAAGMEKISSCEPEGLEDGSAGGQGKQDTDILYLLQDMREFELYGTVRAVVSSCDSMNYILEEEKLLQVFSLVNNYLDPGGIFIFDMNTLYKYREVLGETTICENREEGSFIWENFYDETEQINQYDLTLFIQEENGLYRRYQETHLQRGYEAETVRALLERAGMEFIGMFEAFTKEPVKETSERIYFIARERGK